jgi:hypothetical protein
MNRISEFGSVSLRLEFSAVKCYILMPMKVLKCGTEVDSEFPVELS